MSSWEMRTGVCGLAVVWLAIKALPVSADIAPLSRSSSYAVVVVVLTVVSIGAALGGCGESKQAEPSATPAAKSKQAEQPVARKDILGPAVKRITGMEQLVFRTGRGPQEDADPAPSTATEVVKFLEAMGWGGGCQGMWRGEEGGVEEMSCKVPSYRFGDTFATAHFEFLRFVEGGMYPRDYEPAEPPKPPSKEQLFRIRLQGWSKKASDDRGVTGYAEYMARVVTAAYGEPIAAKSEGVKWSIWHRPDRHLVLRAPESSKSSPTLSIVGRGDGDLSHVPGFMDITGGDYFDCSKHRP